MFWLNEDKSKKEENMFVYRVAMASRKSVSETH